MVLPIRRVPVHIILEFARLWPVSLDGLTMNYSISRRAASLTPSLTLAIDAKAKQMQAEGIDVVGFGAGEPDFATPPHIVEAAIKALRDGFTKYTASSGTPELRQAAADKFKRDNGLDYKPSQI